MSSTLTPAEEALSQEQLVTMLSNILHLVDNNARRQTEARVVRALGQAANLIHMVNILCHTTQTDLTSNATAAATPTVSAGVRQLAAVLLRKKIFSLWHALPSSAQLELRALLLRQLGHETVRQVRLALAHIVVRLAKMESSGLNFYSHCNDDSSANDNQGSGGDTGGWPELYEATYAAVHDERAEMRELAMVLLYSVAEVFADDAIDQSVRTARATEAVLRGIADTDASVQIAALKAAAALLPSLVYSAKHSTAAASKMTRMRESECADGRGKAKKSCSRSKNASATTASAATVNNNASNNLQQPSVLTHFVQQLVTLCVHVLSVGGAARQSAQSKLGVAAVEVLRELLLQLPQRRYEGVMSHVLEQLVGCVGEMTTVALVRQSCASALGDVAELRTRFLTHNSLRSNDNSNNSSSSSSDNSSRATMVMRVCLTLMAMDDTIFVPDGDDTTHNAYSNSNSNKSTLDEDSDEDEDEAQSPCMVGGFLLSTLATTLPSRLFTHTLMPILTQATESPAEPPHPRTKKAVMIALACLAEGNPSFLRRRLRTTLTLTQRYLNDESPVTREAAAFALSFFCDHLQPEVFVYQDTLLPLLVHRLQDGSESVRCRAAGALETMCEGASSAAVVERHVESLLLPGVLGALSCSARPTQRRLCAVLASMANTGCTSMKMRGPEVLTLLRQPFELPWDDATHDAHAGNNDVNRSTNDNYDTMHRYEDSSTARTSSSGCSKVRVGMSARMQQDVLALRAQATETVGVVARAVGADVFAPHVDYFMTHVARNLQTRHAVLREQSFGFLSCVCEVLGTGFMPYLDDCLECALSSVLEDRAMYTNRHPLAAGATHALMDDMDKPKSHASKDRAKHSEYSSYCEDEDDDNDVDAMHEAEEDSGSEEEIHMRVRTADVEEKSAAVHCLGVFALVLRGPTGMGMARVQRCWQAVSTLEGQFCGNVRANALLTRAKLIQAAYDATVGATTVAATAHDGDSNVPYACCVVEPDLLRVTPAAAAMLPSSLAMKSTASSTTGSIISAATTHKAEAAPSGEVRALLDEFVHLTLLRIMREESDKDVVCAAHEAMTLLVCFFGRYLFPEDTVSGGGPRELVQECIQLLRHRRPCQRAERERDRAGAVTKESRESCDNTNHTSSHGDGSDEDEFMTESSNSDMSSEQDDDELLFGESEELDWTRTLTVGALTAQLTLPEEHDEVLDGAVDLLEAVAAVYEEEFGMRYYPFLFPLLIRHIVSVQKSNHCTGNDGNPHSMPGYSDYEYSAERPAEDVVMALGAMAVVQSRVGPAVNARYFDEALRVCEVTAQQCDDAAGRANAAYLMRVLMENVPQRLTDAAIVHRLLIALWAIAGAHTTINSSRVTHSSHAASCGQGGQQQPPEHEDDEEEVPEATDNAMSAACSLVRCATPDLVPWATVLPALLAHLPMRVDHAENSNAVHTLVYLFESRVDVLSAGPAWLPALTHCVARVLASASVNEGDKQALAGAAVASLARAAAEQSSLVWLWQRTLDEVGGEELAVLSAVGLGRRQ